MNHRLLFSMVVWCLSLLPVWSREPVLWWTPAEASAIREQIATHPLGQAQLQKTLAQRLPNRPQPLVLVNLFRASVLQEEAMAEKEKAELLKFIVKKPEPLTWDRDPKTLVWNEGMPSAGDRHMRDDQSLNVWRYDVLYDRLSPEERAGVEMAFREYIRFHLDGAPPRHPQFSYTRTGLLPNMHWPRPIGTHLMALVMRDEENIRAMFEGEGGFKWFMDVYLADGFYMEEFAKYYSNITAMLLWCEGLERIGLGQYGYGYTSPNGNNMELFLRMFLRIGYPRTDIPGGLPNFRRVTLGDAKGSTHSIQGVFEHSVVAGYLANGTGGESYWQNSHMNGPYPKGLTPMWFEVAARRWPGTGFEYFLHQMREPGQDTYLPTLLFGLKPFDPATIQPPAAPSYLTRERGFAFLRMEESPAYWESPRPAVVQQFGMYYVHYTHDCFSLLGYHAFNRPIYMNAWGGGAGGYAGGHPWRDSTRGHAGVTVNHQRPTYIDRGERGLENHRNLRFASGPEYKVSGALAPGLWPGVDAERVLLLTDDYLIDVYRLESETENLYDWHVHGPGYPRDAAAWEPTTELDNGALYRPPGTPPPENVSTANDLLETRKQTPGAKNWSAAFVQSRNPSVAPEASVLGDQWYARGIGVVVAFSNCLFASTVGRTAPGLSWATRLPTLETTPTPGQKEFNHDEVYCRSLPPDAVRAGSHRNSRSQRGPSRLAFPGGQKKRGPECGPVDRQRDPGASGRFVYSAQRNRGLPQ